MTRTSWTLTIDYTDPETRSYSINSWDRPAIDLSLNFIKISRNDGEILILHEREVSSISLIPVEVPVPKDEEPRDREPRLVPLSHEANS